MSELTVDFGKANLDDCDREPIHIPGSVQPYGALLALDPQTLTVVMAGGATERILKVSPSDLIGQNLDARLGDMALQRLHGLTAGATPQPTHMFELDLNGVTVDASTSLSGGLLLLELEERPQDFGLGSIELVHGMVHSLVATPSLEDLAKTITSEVQAATGFDRVMFYRFAEDDSGHVFAETRGSPTVDSFLDLHYPASDIPVQARRLYVSNWLRHIPDAKYRASPLFPTVNPKTGAPLDLSYCGLRSISPVHLEYLANMGVAATMSLSLVVGGRLWGLVVCHHSKPLYLSARVRAACELFAQLASLQLQNRLEVDLAKARLKAQDLQSRLVLKANRSGLLNSLLGPEPDLLNLIPAAGVAVIAEGVVDTEGLTPDPQMIPLLLGALDGLVTDGVFATDRFAELTGLDLGRGIAGILALAISREPKDYILWFLPEQVHEVRWGGDPSKPVESGPLGDRLTPRKSFEIWTEAVKGRSRPWTQVEVEAAALLRVSLLDLVLQRLEQLAQERSVAHAQQDLLMAELDHRVKNSLATIQSMVRFSGRSADDLVSFVSSVESRLQSMAKTHNLLTRARWEGASIRTMVQDELRAHDIPGGRVIEVRGADFDLEPKAALAMSMALHELVTNAIKHGCLSEADGRLNISWQIEAGADGRRLVVRWSETCSHPITAPSRTGFGRILLERVFANDVGGAVDLDFRPDGLKCRLEIPESRVTPLGEAIETERQPSPQQTRPDVLDGVRVLVVEDSALVAEALAEWLRADGASVVGPYYTLREGADGARAHGDIDVALLDVDVNGQPVWSLAADLRAGGVPFILTTGFSADIKRPSEFVDTPVVNKPYDLGELRMVIGAALQRTALDAL